jgi:DNA modification methylase
MLTEPGDIVLDIFAGSNTTGRASERLNRRWLSFDSSLDYLKASVFRFIEGFPVNEVEKILKKLIDAHANFTIPANKILIENTASADSEKIFQELPLFR